MAGGKKMKGSRRTYDNINEFGSDKSEIHLIHGKVRFPPPSEFTDTSPGWSVDDDWVALPDIFRNGCAGVVQKGLFGLVARTWE